MVLSRRSYKDPVRRTARLDSNMAAVQNATFTSPLADANHAQIVGNSQIDGILASISQLSGWTVALTVLAMLVAYDQC